MKLKKKRIFFYLLLTLGVNTLVFSQPNQPFNQYIQNMFVLNPAFAGYDGYTTYNLTARKQWLGYKDGPQTYSASGQGRILKRAKTVKKKGKVQSERSGTVGIGGYVFGDRNGAMTQTGGAFTYAYHVHFMNSQLSFGLSLSLTQLGVDKEKLGFDNPEPTLIIRNTMYPDAAIGTLWSNTEGYVGLSIRQLTQAKYKFSNTDVNLPMLRQYNIVGGYTFPIGDKYDIEPSTIIRFNEPFIKKIVGSGSSMYDWSYSQIDLGTKLFIHKMYWAGFYYRTTYQTTGTYILSIGIRLNEFLIGYAFDYSNTAIANVSYGSHEIVLAAKFGNSTRRFKWLDRF